LGYISDVNATLLSFFPNRTIANRDSRKEAITLEHLLTMTAGFVWDENTNNSWVEMQQSGDWVQHMLDLPMRSTPGTEWEYSTGVSHLLSAIIQETTGNTTEEFAEQYLFGPLNITRHPWGRDPQDINIGGTDLSLTPRSMAKFGFLFLHNGSWEGQQVVPKNWVLQSTSPLNEGDQVTHYGYQWWVHPAYGLFVAQGYHTQLIYVIPSTNTVVVFTAGSPLFAEFLHLVETYIVPEIQPTPDPIDITPFLIAIVGISGAFVIVVIVYYYKRPRVTSVDT
jgi:CubicO group peptidase (beta-lactamase class C family)